MFCGSVLLNEIKAQPLFYENHFLGYKQRKLGHLMNQ